MKTLVKALLIFIPIVKSELNPCWLVDQSTTQLCIQSNSSKSDKPPTSQETKILVTPIVEMKDVMAIDASKKTMKIDLRIILVWNDNRLALSNTFSAIK